MVGRGCGYNVTSEKEQDARVKRLTERTVAIMSGVSASEDLSPTCSVYSVESEDLELSETEGGLETI